MSSEEKWVYVPMAADTIHPGHINIIEIASKLGKVIVGLFTDEAISSYKRVPVMNYQQRKQVVEHIKGVDIVVKQESRDYEPNLRKYKPAYMVHGTDWRTGPLSEVRERAIKVMGEWGGEIVEPQYTKDISSSELHKKQAVPYKGHVYWINGGAEAGKTAVGEMLYGYLRCQKENIVFLDEDILSTLFIKNDSIHKSKEKILLKCSGLCKILSDQGLDVVICTAFMDKNAHDWNKENFEWYKEIYLKVCAEEQLIVEESGEPDLCIENLREYTPEKALKQIIVDLNCNHKEV